MGRVIHIWWFIQGKNGRYRYRNLIKWIIWRECWQDSISKLFPRKKKKDSTNCLTCWTTITHCRPFRFQNVNSKTIIFSFFRLKKKFSSIREIYITDSFFFLIVWKSMFKRYHFFLHWYLGFRDTTRFILDSLQHPCSALPT